VKRVAVIGGGASGLVCAIECAKAGLDITLFEQNEKCGKKILVSGNGKCNITNKFLHIEDFEGEDKRVVETVLQHFGFKQQQDYFASLGLLLQLKEDGRCYPYSMEAKSVLGILLAAAKQYGVKLRTGVKVQGIQKGFQVLLEDGKQERFDKVVVAAGSCAASHLGGNESGYEIAKSFGHTIATTYPSLVQLVSSSKYPKMMSGVKIEAEVTLVVNGVKEEHKQGDLLFTDYGLSGLCVLDLSQKASQALLLHSAVDIQVNLLPRWNQTHLASHITKVAANNPDYTIQTVLHTLLPIKVVDALLHFLDIDKQSRQMDMKLVKRLVYRLQHWSFAIEDTKGFRYAEVSGGGVRTFEVEPKTFESKKQKGLYFIGEVLDVVGRRGGFNFAFAWGSGYLCAQALIKKLK